MMFVQATPSAAKVYKEMALAAAQQSASSSAVLYQQVSQINVDDILFTTRICKA
jgi:hypothetical protein